MIELIKRKRFDNLTFDDLIVDEKNKDFINYLKDYCKNIEKKMYDSENIILSGSVGVGKTMMARILKNELDKIEISEEIATGEWDSENNKCKTKKIRRKMNVKYICCNELIQVTREHFDRKKSENFDYQYCDFLIIDEIGVQYGTEAERTSLYKLFNYRYENYKPTMIISNNKLKEDNPKKPKGLNKIIGSRILDRLYSDNSRYFRIEAKSRRKNNI